MNALYDKGRQSFLDGEISWSVNNIKVVLIDTNDYIVDLATDQFLSDIPLAARVATSPDLAGKTSTDGIADANDATFTAVSGDVSEALVIFKDTATEGTSNLIAYIDSAGDLPVTPNGGDIVVRWSDLLSKIFKL